MASLLDVARALTFFRGLEGAEVERLPGGLINETFLVRFGPQRYVLQRVADIFDPAIHHNIAAVTEHLARHDIVTPQLIPARDGSLWVELEDSSWRLMTHVAGVTHQRVPSPDHAAAAAALVGRVHAALDTLDHAFVGARVGVHDTAKHLDELDRAVSECHGHPLHDEVSALAAKLVTSAATLPPLPALDERVCHGDLKISNILFDGNVEQPNALCLVDLDTLGPMRLAHELGDAWRSWCNPMEEDVLDAAIFDVTIFEASWQGYQSGYQKLISPDARRALVSGPEWISLELAARFAADALRQRYFGWDSSRFATRGEHNLVRAQAQYALHRATVSTRNQRNRVLGVT